MALKKLDESKYSVPTRLIYGKSVSTEWDYTHHVIPPISASSTFRLESSARGAEGFEAIGRKAQLGPDAPHIYVYDRMGEPNNEMLQDALAIAEGGEVALTFATGMAAIHAATAFSLKQGDEIISHQMIYGCTYSLFRNWMARLGITVHLCDLTDPDSFIPLVNDRTKILYLESPANPTLELIDLPAVMERLKAINSKRAGDRKILSIIDNTFATPWAQRPLEFGVDIVVHSLTKGIGGFGTTMGGAVVTRKEFQDELSIFKKDFGGTMAPQTAWNIFVYGVSTLPLRLPRQQTNAQLIASFLEKHAAVSSVRYPGLPSFPQAEIARKCLKDYDGNFAPGFMVYFTLKGRSPAHQKERGKQLMDFIAQNSYSITLAVSLGQLRTLIEHPGSMTHISYTAEEQLAAGMDPGGVRLAVGIENSVDLLEDLETALQYVEQI